MWRLGSLLALVMLSGRVFSSRGPCSTSAYGRVCSSEDDVRDVIDYPTGTYVCLVVMCDARMVFDLAYVGNKAYGISCFVEVVGMHL